MTGTSIHNTIAVRNVFENIPTEGLKWRTVRGGAVTVAAPGSSFHSATGLNHGAGAIADTVGLRSYGYGDGAHQRAKCL